MIDAPPPPPLHAFHTTQVQTVTVDLYDEDKRGSENLNDHSFQGRVQFTLGELFSGEGTKMSLELANEKSRAKKHGTITIAGELVEASSDFLTLQLCGMKLANKDGWGITNKSDPFFIIKKAREDGSWIQVHKSEHVWDNLNPVWKPSTMSVQAICNGDIHRPLKIEVWDWDKNGGHDAMGTVDTTLSAIMSKEPMLVYETIQKKGKPDKFKQSGHLIALEANVVKRHTFLEYIKSGWELDMMVAEPETTKHKPQSTNNNFGTT